MTYFLTKEDFLALSEYSRASVIDSLQQAAESGQLVSVRAEDVLDATEVHPVLYGVYTMSQAQWDSYVASGGSWSFVDPREVARDYGLDL